MTHKEASIETAGYLDNMRANANVFLTMDAMPPTERAMAYEAMMYDGGKFQQGGAFRDAVPMTDEEMAHWLTLSKRTKVDSLVFSFLGEEPRVLNRMSEDARWDWRMTFGARGGLAELERDELPVIDWHIDHKGALPFVWRDGASVIKALREVRDLATVLSDPLLDAAVDFRTHRIYQGDHVRIAAGVNQPLSVSQLAQALGNTKRVSLADKKAIIASQLQFGTSSELITRSLRQISLGRARDQLFELANGTAEEAAVYLPELPDTNVTEARKDGEFLQLVDSGALKIADSQDYSEWLAEFVRNGGQYYEIDHPWEARNNLPRGQETGLSVRHVYKATQDIKHVRAENGTAAWAMIIPDDVQVTIPEDLKHSEVLYPNRRERWHNQVAMEAPKFTDTPLPKELAGAEVPQNPGKFVSHSR